MARGQGMPTDRGHVPPRLALVTRDAQDLAVVVSVCSARRQRDHVIDLKPVRIPRQSPAGRTVRARRPQPQPPILQPPARDALIAQGGGRPQPARGRGNPPRGCPETRHCPISPRYARITDWQARRQPMPCSFFELLHVSPGPFGSLVILSVNIDKYRLFPTMPHLARAGCSGIWRV